MEGRRSHWVLKYSTQLGFGPLKIELFACIIVYFVNMVLGGGGGCNLVI